MENSNKTICLNFKRDLAKFTDSVCSLTENGSLSHQEAFLLDMADTIHKLYDASVKILECDNEDVQEIGELVKNIFLQPLTTKKKKDLTIIHAVESFSTEKAKESDLSAILFEYITHPESTKSFIRELELLTEDLDSAIRTIA